ncbi:hypothetical protein [Amycolatopsis saalfeldensis]|uniref:Uncharacterized protein n=1 Tax=Amycolatopsis saalfeldensis TaxID=394193 RepID=A0A1H8YBE3_9PSEU|nr:hypothetical protein [Amycolatopsis saalfeldensis]SEP49406.1 hypothetical protein SAMN04489732_11338 [Amycolatopsis saalfeldensis]
MAKFRRRAAGEAVFAALLTLGGVALFFAGHGLVTSIFVVAIFGTYLGLSVHNLAVSLWMKPFQGKVRPNRMRAGCRVHRRKQDRGAPVRRPLAPDQAPQRDAAPVRRAAPVEPTSPRLDPVLAAHRWDAARTLVWFAVASVVVFGWAVWSGPDFAHGRPLAVIPAAIALVGLGLILLRFVFFTFLMFRPVPHDTWTELGVVLDGPVRVNGRGVARLRGRTTLPDGRPITFRGAWVPVSVAANVAATGQLWTAGLPRPGKSAAVVLPGHAVFGTVRFG